MMFKVLPFLAVSLAVSCKTSSSSSLQKNELPPVVYPALNFSEAPSFIPNDMVILTFDDAPDWTHTAVILDVLKEKGVKASFFINNKNFSNLETEIPMQDLIKRMVNVGHELANHTAQHLHLGSLTREQVRSELCTVEQSVRRILGKNDLKLTLIRAPFGEPYQLHQQGQSLGDYEKVAPVVAEHGVHIGWNVDSFDYDCQPGNADCVILNVMDRLKKPGEGAHGMILLHSVHSQTAAALPGLIDRIRAAGYEFGLVEDAVRARFGKDSAALIGNAPRCVSDKGEPRPASKGEGCSSAAWVQGTKYLPGDQVVFEKQVFRARHDNNGLHPKISHWYWEAFEHCGP